MEIIKRSKNCAFFVLIFVLGLTGLSLHSSCALGYYGIHNNHHGHHGGLGLGHSSNFGFHGNHHSGFGHNSYSSSYGHHNSYNGNGLHSSRRHGGHYNNGLHRPYRNNRIGNGDVGFGQTVIIINQSSCNNRSYYIEQNVDNVRESAEELSISSRPYVFSNDDKYEPDENAYVFRYDNENVISNRTSLVVTNDVD